MESGFITNVFLPLALAIIMLGMGLSLTIDDFKKVLKFPKAVAIGLLNQLILLPIIGFGTAYIFDMQPEFAVGIIILAACPGGVTSNLISHLSKGDTALSVSLTAISSLVTVFSIPFVVSLGIDLFIGQGNPIESPVGKIMGSTIAITLIPVVIGMLIRKSKAEFAVKMESPVKIASSLFLALIIAGAIVKNKSVFETDEIGIILLSTIALNLCTMFLGLIISKAGNLNLKQTITISIESGIQNGTLAIFIAATLLQNSLMSITPAIYSLVMFASGGIMIFVFGRKKHNN